ELGGVAGVAAGLERLPADDVDRRVVRNSQQPRPDLRRRGAVAPQREQCLQQGLLRSVLGQVGADDARAGPHQRAAVTPGQLAERLVAPALSECDEIGVGVKPRRPPHPYPADSGTTRYTRVHTSWPKSFSPCSASATVV